MCRTALSLLILILLMVLFALVTSSDDTVNQKPSTEEMEIAKDFFQLNDIEIGVIVDCSQTNYKTNALKFFSSHFIQISITDLNTTSEFDRLLKLQFKFQLAIIIMDFQCPRVIDLIEYCSNQVMFNVSYHWLIFDQTDAAPNILENAMLHINADITVVVKDDNRWLLSEIYNPGKHRGGALEKSLYAEWTSEKRFNIVDKRAMYVRRRDMKGLSLITGFAMNFKLKVPVDDYMRAREALQLQFYIPHLFQMTEHVAAYHNFRTKFKRSPGWGFYIGNGSWNGLMNELVLKKTDLCNAAYVIRGSKIGYVDFVPVGCFPLQNAFMFRHPKLRPDRITFILPISNEAWNAVLGCTCLVIIFLKCTLWLEKCKLHLEEEYAGLDNSWSSILLIIFAAFFQQGMDNSPTLVSGRVATGTFLLFCVMFYQYYSARLLSTLLLEPPKSILSIKALYESDIKVGINPRQYALDWLGNTTDPHAQKLYHEKILKNNKGPPNFYRFPEETTRLIGEGGIAIFDEVSRTLGYAYNTWSERAKCDYTAIPFGPLQVGFIVLPRHSPYLKMMSIEVLKQIERGVNRRNMIKNINLPLACTLGLGDQVDDVAFGDVASAFVMIGVVYGTACGIMSLEMFHMFWKKLQSARKSRKMYIDIN